MNPRFLIGLTIEVYDLAQHTDSQVSALLSSHFGGTAEGWLLALRQGKPVVYGTDQRYTLARHCLALRRFCRIGARVVPLYAWKG